jgi:hypothetical protein
VLIALGLAGYAIAMPGLTLAGASFDVHTLVVASMILTLGAQSVMFAVLTTTYGIKQRLRPSTPNVDRFFRLFTLERGVIAGLSAVLAGLLFVLASAFAWYRSGFGPLDYATTMRVVVPGATLVTLGSSVVLNSFLCSMLGLDRR